MRWLQRLDFMLFHAATSTSPKSLTMELWQKAGFVDVMNFDDSIRTKRGVYRIRRIAMILI